MIELTSEMVMALWRILPSDVQEGREPADVEPWVDAVLTVVDRIQPRPTPAPTRCADCGRAARELVAVPDGVATVWLGPTCRRRRAEAAAVRQTLPIGGDQ